MPTSEDTKLRETLQQATTARVAVGRTGTRPPVSAWLQFRQDHALARDAVKSELSDSFLKEMESRGFPIITSLANSRHDFVLFPPKGKRTTDDALTRVAATCVADCDVAIVISDGLSASAVENNIPDLLPMLEQGFKLEGISYTTPVVVRYGRVAIADQLGHVLRARVAINLIGERPGLSTSNGLSAYITYNPGPATISSDRTVVSNIHCDGTPPVEAGAYIVSLVKQILQKKASGVKLQQLS